MVVLFGATIFQIPLAFPASFSSGDPFSTASEKSLVGNGNSASAVREMTIIVLTMDRFHSLERLLQSLQQTDYQGDVVNLQIRFDRPKHPSLEWIQAVENLRTLLPQMWTAGQSSMTVARENRGLRQAWLEAWQPRTDDERAIIFEDDTEVSPIWYSWLRGAHDAYGTRSDLAGFSLQRQYLVPLKKARAQISDNEGKPFLYKLVGFIGFSPKASTWIDFVDFANCAIANQLDVSVAGLITSEWYTLKNQQTMWTQLFIYFCEYRHLSSLYVFPANNRALAAHYRKKGEHFSQTNGADFALAQASDVLLEYPANLVSLGWDAKPLPPQKTVLHPLVMSAAVGYGEAEFLFFVTRLRKYYRGSISLLIAQSAPDKIKQLLVDYNVSAVETTEDGGPRDSLGWHRINKIRYTFYQDTCQASLYDLCMTIDFRDVLFQDDPFFNMEVPSGPTIHLYLHNLMVNDWALHGAMKCNGTNKAIRDQWMINAGGFIATPSVFPQLTWINQKYGAKCDDQIGLNLAVYGKQLNGTKVIIHQQGEGSVNNVAYKGVFKRDSHNRFLNHNCFPAPVAHQFDLVLWRTKIDKAVNCRISFSFWRLWLSIRLLLIKSYDLSKRNITEFFPGMIAS